MTDMRQRWKAIPEDTIGGWCVVLESETRTPAGGATPIADFCTEEVATHVAEAHNAFLERWSVEDREEHALKICE